MGALVCAMTWWLGRYMFGSAVGVGAGIGAACYGPLIFFDGELLPAALAAQVGSIQGPIEITATDHRQGGFSLFKVLHKTEAELKPYAEAEKQIRYWWTRQEENRLYGELVDRLREKHAASVAVYRDHLVAQHGASQS